MENETIIALNQIIEKIALLADPSKNPTEIWVTPAFTLAGVVIGAAASHFFGFQSQVKLDELKAKREVYGELMGLKFSLSQLYVSRFEAFLFSDFYEKRWELTGKKIDSFDFKEANRWMHKSEELSISISVKQQDVFRTIGLVNALFIDSDEKSRLVDSVYKFKDPVIFPFPNNVELNQLEALKKQGVEELQDKVKSEITAPIDNLLEYLKKCL